MIYTNGIHECNECIPGETTYFMTVERRPTWAYEQRDELVTLQ